MKLVIFGLTVSSSWGNGHATLWRGLWRALARRGHRIVFFERDVPYYAGHRDLTSLPGGELVLYRGWDEALPQGTRELADADVAMVTSYCPDGVTAADLVLNSSAEVKSFYDLDTPITFERLRAGETVAYLPPGGLADFDLVLSYTGGAALDALRSELGARRVAPLYGSVDPEAHYPVPAVDSYRSDLSYLGTYAADRQQAVESLLVEPARRLPHKRFVIGGAQYPHDFPWTANIHFVRHMPPPEHPAFFCSSRLTLNVTRRAMAEMGYCPSGRLFEAAACGTPVLSDWWEGLDAFFEPGREVLIARSTEDAVNAIELSDAELAKVARAAHERTLNEHTADHRARELEQAIETPTRSASARPPLQPATAIDERGLAAT
jgi:spore maturation protein CgeB